MISTFWKLSIGGGTPAALQRWMPSSAAHVTTHHNIIRTTPRLEEIYARACANASVRT